VRIKRNWDIYSNGLFFSYTRMTIVLVLYGTQIRDECSLCVKL